MPATMDRHAAVEPAQSRQTRWARWVAWLAWALLVISPGMFAVWIAASLAHPDRGRPVVLGGVVLGLAAPIVALVAGVWAGRHGSRSGTFAAAVAVVVVGVLTVWMGLSGWGA